MEQFKPPEPLSLDGNLSENWRRWQQRFELYLEASGVSEKAEKTQAATLLHVVSSRSVQHIHVGRCWRQHENKTHHG